MRSPRVPVCALHQVQESKNSSFTLSGTLYLRFFTHSPLPLGKDVFHPLSPTFQTRDTFKPVINLDLVGQVLALQRAPFETMLAVPGGLPLALGVVFAAGLSISLGQSIVLFANHVRRSRFIASLLMGGVLYVFGFLFLVMSIWLVAKYGFGRDQFFTQMVRAVGLSYAPFLFGFFVLTPYLGSFFSVILSLWNLSALLIALVVTLDLSLLQALLCSVLGWLLLQIVGRTVGRPIQALARLARRLVAGQTLELNRGRLQDLIRRGRRK